LQRSWFARLERSAAQLGTEACAGCNERNSKCTATFGFPDMSCERLARPRLRHPPRI
jgi:hypothetical protein